MARDADRVRIRASLETQVDTKSLNQASKKIANQTKRDIESLSNQTDMTKLIRDNMPSQKAFRNYEAPLGRINGLVNDFDKSLAASNARVLAFGASVASVGAVERAFSSLLNSTIEVQKALKELQVISEATNSEIVEYGNRLFDVARNTATSFKDAAKAALEFSRQGLSMNQILERTNDTMIMMRITGISLDEAINGLTATINAFSNEDLSSGEILNALSAIDLAAAASTDGIIKGMARSASAARSAGVSFRELAAFIATLQETTGLQGGVLGNSAKSIFTRIIDPSKLATLRNFNIKVESDNGELLETMDILKNMAQTIKGVGGVQAFDDKSDLVKFLKEMSGLYQIDKLTSMMNDLGRSLQDLGPERLAELDKNLSQVGISLNGPNGLRKGIDVLTELDERIRITSNEFEKSNLQKLYSEVAQGVSRYDRNLLNANQASDEAYQKNELLNQTLDAQIQKLKTTGIELGSAFGNTAFLEDLTEGLISVNEILAKITDGIKGEGSLAFLQNIVQGIGSVLTGPGLVLAIATIGKGISYMAKQTKDSWISFMDLNKASQRQIQYEQLLNNLYQNNASIQEVIADTSLSRTAQAQKVVALLDSEVAKSQTLAKIYAEIAATMTSMTTLNVSQANIGAYQKGKFVQNKASGDNAFVKEQKAIQMGIGGARKTASPVIMNNFPLDGIKQTVVANTDEVIVDAGNGKYKILNRNQVKELTKSKNFASGWNPVSKVKESVSESWVVRDIEKNLINRIENLTKTSNEASKATENLSRSISKDSVEREKSLTNLVKWTVAASFLNGALLDVSENSSNAAKVVSWFGNALQSIITLKMAGSAFGVGTSWKDIKASPTNAWKKIKEGFSGASEIRQAGQRAANRTFSGDIWGSSASVVFNLFKNFKALAPIVKGIAGAFTKMLPVVGWLITAWQIMPDSWTDAIKSTLGLIDTPAEKAAKAINEMTQAAIKNSIASKRGPTYEEAGKAGQKAFLEYRAQYAIQKNNLKDVKNYEQLFNSQLSDAVDGLDLSGIKGIIQKELDTNFANSHSRGNSKFGNTPSGIILPGREYEQDFIKSINGRSRFGNKTILPKEFDKFNENLLSDTSKSIYQGINAQIESFTKEATLGKFFENDEGQRKYQELLKTDVDKAKEYLNKALSDSASTISAPLAKAISEFNQSDIGKKKIAQGQDVYLLAVNDLLSNLTGDFKKTAKELGVSEETLKEVRKVAYNFASTIKRIKNDFLKLKNQTELLRIVPTSADLDLTRANIYGSPTEKLQAQYNVAQQNRQRAREDNAINLRQSALNFIEKNLVGGGFRAEKLQEAESIIQNATSSQEIRKAFAILTEWENGLEKLTPEQNQKLVEFYENIDKIDAKASLEELKSALNNSTIALAEFAKYINNIRFQEALSNVELRLEEFSNNIKNLNSDTKISDTILSALERINPAISPGIEVQKSQLEYQSSMRQIALEQEKYFAEIEKELIQRISNLSSPQDKDNLLALVQEIQKSENGFSDIDSVGNLVEKIALAEQNNLKEEQKTRLSLALQELQSAELQYKAANIQLDAAEVFSKFVGLRDISSEAKGMVKNILPDAIKNMPFIKYVLRTPNKNISDERTRASQQNQERIIKALDNLSRNNSPVTIATNERRKYEDRLSSEGRGTEANTIQVAGVKLAATLSQLDKALELRANQQLTIFASKIKQVSDAITKFRLNLEKDDVDLEAGILMLPDDVKETIKGLDLLNKASKEAAIGQMEVAQANIEQRKRIFESISQVSDTLRRGEIYKNFSSGASNDEIRKQIASALADQDITGLKSNDIFRESVNDFGRFNDVFKTAVEEFEKAIEKEKDKNFSSGASTNSLARRRNESITYRGMGTVNGQVGAPANDTGLLPTNTGIGWMDRWNPFGYSGDLENSEIASPISESNEALKENTELTKTQSESLKDSTQTNKEHREALYQSYLTQLKDTEAIIAATQAQINQQKALNEANKYINRFAIAANQAATAATALGKYQAQRIGDIDKEGVRTVQGYEGKRFSVAQKEAFDNLTIAKKKKDDEGIEKYSNDLIKIQEELNKRTEFKTFNEGWNESIAQMSDDAKRLEENMGKMIGTIKDGFVDVFTDAITGAKSFEDAMTDMVQNVANQIIKHGLNSLLSNMFSGIGKMGSGGQSAVDASQSGMGGGIFSWISSLFAEGGQVVGGSGVRDDVPALLTGGEYVLKKDVVSRVGKDYLDMLNSGKVSKFATGGYVKGRNSERWYLDNGGYPTDTSKSNNGAGGFYSPGKYGYGSIVGRNNLKSFATQSFTSGQYDVIKQNETGGVIGLENESWRISAYGRNADTVENQTTEADKREAFNLADQEQKQADALEKERKKRKKSLWKSIIGAAATIGLTYVTGGLGATSSWGLVNLLGGGDSSLGRGIQTFQGAFGNGPRGEDQTNILRGLFGMKKLEKQKASGGSITSGTSGRDTTPINAMQGEYVISRNAARNIGTPFLDALNNNRVSFDNGANQSSGPVGMDFSKLIDKFDEMISVVREAFEGSAGNITINVTENGNGSSQETQQGQTTEENNRLAQRIKEVVRATILEEKRVGGMLNSTRA